MIDVHFLSQNMGIVRAEIGEAAKAANVPSELFNNNNKKTNQPTKETHKKTNSTII